MRRIRPLAAALLMLASCKSCDDPPKERADAGPAPSTPVPPPSADAAAPAAQDAAAAADEPYGDAGVSACRLVYGPAEQPFRGPAALEVAGHELRLVANDAGKPRVYPVPIAPLPPKNAPSLVPPRPSTFTGMRWPPCELAGRFVYCQAPGGAIVRSVAKGRGPDDGSGASSSRTIAKSRSGTRIAAASLGADHSVVAFLDVRRTTEGEMLQAFVALDEREPVRLSEDGAGATTLRFLPRGETPVAVYLDTRTAMVPVHARVLSLREGDLSLGSDAVLFVGGAPERGIDFAAAPVGDKGLAFVPIPRETIDFGVATLVIDDPPKDDVGAVWSHYPNGLDPAPIAAAPSRDGKHAWVARVRPREKAPGSPRILELGRADAAGTFSSLGEIASGQRVTDVAVVEDGAGAVWVLYGDTTITWLERRACP
ncbi:MAG: hypothetical protein KF764_12395 [Labilithrix sp.]|nr:hypothetical protein [Labilithrix sp.]